MAWLLPAALTGALLMTPSAPAGDVGFAEAFALAPDRSVPLKQLIPGTEDYYYYHALHRLNSEQYEEAEKLTQPWHQRFGQTARLTEIQTRHALLTYDRNPQKSLAYLRDRLGVRFDQQREVPGAAPNVPTALAPNLIARDTLTKNSFARWQGLDNFEDAALDRLAATDLTWQRRRALLQRLSRPDVPNLPQLVADDLAAEHAPDFGAYPIHTRMTLAQFEELVKLRPALLNHPTLVRAWAAKLQPGADDDWRRDRAVANAYFDRLIAFADRLGPVHNSLKAHALYHRLVLDRSEGTYDKARFLKYLALPRHQFYMPQPLREAPEALRHPADLNADYAPATLLPPVGPDEPLVRDYLRHFLADAANPKEFEPFVDGEYLRHLFAEVKIEAGLGDPETWASQLPPERFRQLKDRVDIDFAFTNKTDYAVDEPVKLDLFVKNVPSLIVKVFEINTPNFYRTYQKEVDTDINLDGLVANQEAVHPHGEPPLRRVARRFEFPDLTRPGVYVIDVIGGGKSSRALVRKGRLRPLAQVGPAGLAVTVLDEANKTVPGATVWLGGQEYRADASGTATVPFSTAPGRRPVVLGRGDFASLDHVEHPAETYQLVAGTHVERESLLSQRVAPVLVRPGLFLNGRPVSVKLLEDVKLKLTTTDLGGIVTSVDVPDFQLFEDRESMYEFRVPPRLAALTVTLTARVKSLSTGQPVDLSSGYAVRVNGIAATDKIDDLHLARFGDQWVIEALGRTGEVRPDRAVQVALKHREFKEPVRVTLKTDATGRVRLGTLPDIETVTATGPNGTAHTWPTADDEHTYRSVIHARVGEPIAVPYLGTAAQPTRAELALLAVRGDDVRADRFDALAIANGMVELRGLTPGDYDLLLKREGQRIRVRVVDGPVTAGYVLGPVRNLELPRLQPVQIESITADAETVTVKLRNATEFARVHVLARRYRPAFSAFDDLAAVRAPALGGVYPGYAPSVYLTGRNIGDEYRYVLDRRGQRKFPGNMLDRPSLLLNPWAVRDTEAAEQLAREGDEFAKKGEMFGGGGVGGLGGRFVKSGGGNEGFGNFADLDFLAEPAAVMTNLLPDKDGVVRVPRAALGSHGDVRVVAVDPLGTTARSAWLPEAPAKVLDLRLRASLDPAKRFTLQKRVSVLAEGQPFTLDDVAGSRFEAYDSLARVYGLFATLSNDPKLTEFAFVPTWAKLKPEEKRATYSKYACHELHYFLSKKDPEFFAAVVRPYLANKKDKTFLDHFLLGDDVTAYQEPWNYSRLNTVERVLLASRAPNEPARTRRHLTDLLRLVPPQTDRLARLFDTAVQAGELSANGALQKQQEKERLMLRGAVADDMPALGMAGRPADPQAAAKPTSAPPAPATPAPAVEVEKKFKELRRRDGATKRDESRETAKDADKLNELKFFEEQQKELAAVRPLYRPIERTKEWAENNYYHLPIQAQVADLVPVGAFWADLAAHDGNGPFLSKHFPEASRNFTEMMFALSVLDLPFEAKKADPKFDGGAMTLTPAGPTVAFHEEVRPAEGPGGAVSILVSQNVYRHGDRYRDENGERLDKFVTGEFVTHTVYGLQVVVTNPTSARQKLSVLAQVPAGSIPLNAAKPTQAVAMDLEPFRTQTLDVLFYFPRPGTFAHYPVTVARDEKFVAAAAPATFTVVETPTKLDTTSWEYVSQNGTTEQVLAFLDRENVAALNLDKIAFRMKDRAFYEAVLKLLAARHTYSPTLWSFALFHADPGAAQQYLRFSDRIAAEAGGAIASPLLTLDPVARHAYEHLEYKPLVNARAHALGPVRQILNDRFHDQYHRFLHQLSYRRTLTDADQLGVAYYLLLQDRTADAMEAFAQVNPDKVPSRLQYDYCAAYLEMFGDEPAKARAIASRYAAYPVDRWRSAFAAVVEHLDEAEGKGPKAADPADRAAQMGQLAATEPSFDVTTQTGGVQLTWQNLGAVRVNYYLMDVELLFSRNPFVKQGGGQFASIKPNATKELTLPAGQTRLVVPLPEEFARRNVLVEVTAAGQSKAVPVYATAMDVTVIEPYGQVKVTDPTGGKPLPKVYVKVYAKLADGSVKFHKDGYTDLRGRFDYATVSTPERSPAERFAVLVLSDDRGATIREANPPQR